MQFTHEHREIQKTLKRFIDEEINPHVDEWEAAEIFPPNTEMYVFYNKIA